MRAIRLTKAEVAFLRNVLGPGHDWTCLGTKAPGLAADILRKIGQAEAPQPEGTNVVPIQDAMVGAARGKVVRLVTGYPVASRRCAQLGVTPEDARLVGEWMARQHWLRGPQTLLDVLNKWPQWLSKARATEPPPSLKEGFDADAGQGANGEGQGAAQGRPARGFR